MKAEPVKKNAEKRGKEDKESNRISATISCMGGGGEQEMFLPFLSISPHLYPVIVNSFPNKLYYYFY
jgi:hypothetical protein